MERREIASVASGAASHPLLARQLKRLRLDRDRPPQPDEWRAFVARVESAYRDADQRNYLSERALAVSSSEMAELHDRLNASRARLAAVFETASVGLCVLDLDGVVEDINPAALVLLRVAETDVVGHTLWDSVSVRAEAVAPDDGSVLDAVAWTALRSALRPWRIDEAVVACGAVVFHAACMVTPIIDASRGFSGAVLVVRDVTDQRRAQSELRWQASHDLLTGLPNRASILRRLDDAIVACELAGRTDVAVMFIDLDQFKVVNDTHGHAAGDDLLKAVAARVTSCVRSGDAVGRLAGDEFVVVCTSIRTEAAERCGHRIAAALAEPVRLGDVVVAISASVGIATHHTGHSAATLLAEADRAMYAAKRERRGVVMNVTAG